MAESGEFHSSPELQSSIPTKVLHKVTQNGQTTMLSHSPELENRMHDLIRGRESKAKSANLSLQELRTLRHVEQDIREFMRQKLQNLGTGVDHLSSLHPVVYTAGNIIQMRGGFDSAGGDITVDVSKRTGDLLTTATFAAHEISHASARNNTTVVHWDIDEKDEVHVRDVYMSSGLDKEDESGVTGSALEHGLALLDATDMYKSIFPKHFQKEFAIRKSMMNSRMVKSQLREEAKGLFAPIRDTDAEPYLGKLELLPGFLKKLTPVIIDTENLHMERFVVEVARTIGAGIVMQKVSDDVLPDFQRETSGIVRGNDERESDYHFRLGRYLLDKERFVDGYDKGTKALEAVFGPNASFILKADDRTRRGVDPGMRFVRAKQRELGMAA
ncbi:MAG: hypothetical protein HY430_01880 [Candidatus Levybacteria bacterium]|nr:hypothetical protein [Candidatus Levybacteria bacterium]